MRKQSYGDYGLTILLLLGYQLKIKSLFVYLYIIIKENIFVFLYLLDKPSTDYSCNYCCMDELLNLKVDVILYALTMNIDSKFGLKSASNILNRIRVKYLRQQAQESQYLPHNKTFIEQQQSLQLYEQVSQKNQKAPSALQTSQKQQKSQGFQEMSAIKARQKKQLNFSDKLIRKKLEQSLQIYKEDLQILYENRKFLEQSIQILGQKIRKIKQLEINNKTLAIQNANLKDLLNQLMLQYHESNRQLFKAQIAQQESFNYLRSKLRIVLKDYTEDYKYIGFVEYWNRYIENSLIQSRQIDLKIQRERKMQQQQKDKEERTKFKKILGAPLREKQFEEQYQPIEQVKPKKRLNQSQKASLLGDLKSFAKSFKFPSK